jgi:S-(hydroxymethyl)glutathione dehydrogenase/alcohol dehydrogenase
LERGLGRGFAHGARARGIRSWGACRHCYRGEEVGCTSRWRLDETSPITDAAGDRIGQGLRTGAFAEQVVVERSQIVPIDADIPLESAALLACGVIAGYGAVVNSAEVRPGDTVVVIGCGGVGLNTIQAAAHSPAARVIAVDVNPAKLDLAIQFGATHTIDSTQADLEASVDDLTGGARADWVFVTVGAKAAYDQSFSLLAAFGAVVLVGMPPDGVTSTIDPTTVANQSQRIVGSKMGRSRIAADIPALVEMYRSGRLRLDELITGRYPLDRINEAIAEVDRGDAVRNVIVF